MVHFKQGKKAAKFQHEGISVRGRLQGLYTTWSRDLKNYFGIVNKKIGKHKLQQYILKGRNSTSQNCHIGILTLSTLNIAHIKYKQRDKIHLYK